MKNVDAKSRKTVWLMALGLLAMVAGPAVTSLGLDSAIGNVIAPAVGPANSFGYQANVVLANDKKESTSGTLKIVDGKRTDIALGNLQMQITPHKVSEGWKFTIETRDSKTDKVVQSASIITSESEGARVESKSDDAAGEDIKAFSLSLAPILHTTSTAEKSAGLIQSGDMVTLNFKDPTDIKDVIKTMAQVSGKNIILSRDIDSKVTVVSDHPIPKKDAYQAFIAALEQVDVVAITEGKAIRLIRKPTAAR